MDTFLRVISKVDRPVVLYFSADHFDSIGPLAEELRGDPVNLMQLRDGKPLELGYFAGNMHWKVRFQQQRLQIVLAGPEAAYLERLEPMLSSGRIQRCST